MRKKRPLHTTPKSKDGSRKVNFILIVVLHSLMFALLYPVKIRKPLRLSKCQKQKWKQKTLNQFTCKVNRANGGESKDENISPQKKESTGILGLLKLEDAGVEVSPSVEAGKENGGLSSMGHLVPLSAKVEEKILDKRTSEDVAQTQ